MVHLLILFFVITVKFLFLFDGLHVVAYTFPYRILRILSLLEELLPQSPGADFTFLENNDLICLVCQLIIMSDDYPSRHVGILLSRFIDDLAPNPMTYFFVQSAESIIDNQDVWLTVDRSG